jgi:hypothetical protein
MIVSHRHKFIFIKTQKTASSSMEVALSQILGPEDIVTPAAQEFDSLRSVGIGGQNFRLVGPDVPKIPAWRRILGRPERYYHPTVGYYEHMPAWRIARYLGEATWRSYFKFAFERNPWDRQVSWYHYKMRNKPPARRLNFDEFNSDPRRARAGNWELYTIDGVVAVDFIGRYENLTEDFARTLDRLRLKDVLELNPINVSDQRKVDYRSYYTDESRALIGKWYQQEIEHFGYSF